MIGVNQMESERPRQPWEDDLADLSKEIYEELSDHIDRLEKLERQMRKHKHAEGEVVVPL